MLCVREVMFCYFLTLCKDFVNLNNPWNVFTPTPQSSLLSSTTRLISIFFSSSSSPTNYSDSGVRCCRTCHSHSSSSEQSRFSCTRSRKSFTVLTRKLLRLLLLVVVNPVYNTCWSIFVGGHKSYDLNRPVCNIYLCYYLYLQPIIEWSLSAILVLPKLIIFSSARGCVDECSSVLSCTRCRLQDETSVLLLLLLPQ